MIYTQLSQVTTPAAVAALVDLPTVKTDLGITETATDAWLNLTINRVSSSITNYCNRTFPVQSYQDTFRPDRTRNPMGDPLLYSSSAPSYAVIQMAAWPTVSIASVNENYLLLDPSLYENDPVTGQLMRLDQYDNAYWWSMSKLVVDYTAGFATIPMDVQDAALRMVRKAWFARTRDPLIKHQSLPNLGDTEFWVSTGNAGNMPPDITDILDNYRMPALL